MKKKSSNKQSGFKTPTNYFNDFDENFFAKLNSDAKLNDGIPLKTGFTLPDGYFAGFENTVLQKTSQHKTKVISIFNAKNFKYVASIAAVLIFSIFFKSLSE